MFVDKILDLNAPRLNQSFFLFIVKLMVKITPELTSLKFIFIILPILI